MKVWRLPKADARETRLAPTRARRQRRKSRHLNQKEKLRFYAGFFFLHSGNGFDCGSWSRHKRAIAVTGSPKKGAAFFWGEEERRRMCGGSAAPAAGAKPAPTKGPRGRG